MAVDRVVTPQILEMIGNQSAPHTAVDEVTTSEIRRWVIATLDDNPLWYDKEYAEKSRFGTNCAPAPYPRRAIGHWRRRPGTGDPVRQLGPDDDFRYGDENLDDPAIKIHWPEGVGAFHAGDDIEYFQFPRVGDVISVVEKIVAIDEKTGRSGKLAIVHDDQTYTNQRGEVLMINHSTSIAREMKWKGQRADHKGGR